jgi:hypothetical protein
MGPAMHHYHCQNVYITATASERIVDTLEFPLAINLCHKCLPRIAFPTIGYDTISALTTLAEIFTRKFKNAEAPVIPSAPIKSAANKQPQSHVQPTLTSPLKRQYKTRSQIHVNPESHNAPQPLMVVTPATMNASPPRVPIGARQLSPRNLSQDFLDMGGAHCAIAFGGNRWITTQMINSVIHTVTGKEMHYKDHIRQTIL